MRIIFASICLFAQTLSAAPATNAERSADGLSVFCRSVSDVGIWAYSMSKSSVTETGVTLNFAIDMSFMKCGDTTAGLDWIARKPFDPISRVTAGKLEVILIDEVNGVLLDGDTYARLYSKAANDAQQTFRFSVNAAEILAKVSELKSGESYTKKFYFVVEHHERLSNGATRYVAGGSYDFNVTWTKQTDTLSLRVTQN